MYVYLKIAVVGRKGSSNRVWIEAKRTSLIESESRVLISAPFFVHVILISYMNLRCVLFLLDRLVLLDTLEWNFNTFSEVCTRSSWTLITAFSVDSATRFAGEIDMEHRTLGHGHRQSPCSKLTWVMRILPSDKFVANTVAHCLSDASSRFICM